MELIYKEEVYQIIGAAMMVHRELGYGFLEPVYQEALAVEFQDKKISFKKEAKLNIFYKNKALEKFYVADFICYDQIIVEIKAVESIIPEFVSQVLNYLNAAHLRLGLIINFGESRLNYKRIVL
ncbi:hypothetical protein BMS3Abin05_02134 [bacterium BMS3Abin05]|nr:hypothetical protein BMS3Abin05_02134 [bacterium BMS3Abin05]GBE26744.1 hypothetical protein BMS3Bbin03_00663 [bacterium BMS3Bbin03]HDZ11143.1 GxxExxY protein [Bacteroidota bacterium]